MRIGLVGCVKGKRSHGAPAQDLYTSPLFRGRRRWVERTCDRWFILSAKHGLVRPDDVLAPYDVTLNGLTTEERRRWSERVIAQLRDEVGPVGGHVFEIHAGAAYAAFGLLSALRGRGAAVEQPAAGLSLGRQLRLYS